MLLQYRSFYTAICRVIHTCIHPPHQQQLAGCHIHPCIIHAYCTHLKSCFRIVASGPTQSERWSHYQQYQPSLYAGRILCPICPYHHDEWSWWWLRGLNHYPHHYHLYHLIPISIIIISITVIIIAIINSPEGSLGIQVREVDLHLPGKPSQHCHREEHIHEVFAGMHMAWNDNDDDALGSRYYALHQRIYTYSLASSSSSWLSSSSTSK